MKNILISIGCDAYENLRPLKGAVADANRFADALLGASKGPYLSDFTVKLDSPCLAELRETLNETLDHCDNVDIFTMYFAGHGGVKAGSYYLATRDSRLDRLSTTAFPIVDLFPFLGELRPRQAYIILDACEAGGIVFDIGSLLKPDLLGKALSTSIAILAGSAADREAMESEDGGDLTSIMLKVLSGEILIDTRCPYLDLVRIGQVISTEMTRLGSDQSPSSWGLNLYGEARFAPNPHYDPNVIPSTITVQGIAPRSSSGIAIASSAENIWDEYRRQRSDPSPRRLHTVISHVAASLTNDPDALAQFLLGISVPMIGRASEGRDVLAGSLTDSTILVSMLPYLEHANIRSLAIQMMQMSAVTDLRLAEEIRDALLIDKTYLVDKKNLFSELILLPIRLSNLLGWMSSRMIANRLVGISNTSMSAVSRTIVELILYYYREALTSVKDSQGSHIALFLKACELEDWEDVASIVICRYFDTLSDARGIVLTASANGCDMFEYALARSRNSLFATDKMARPVEILLVLSWWASRFELGDTLNPLMRKLDRCICNAYVGRNLHDYGKPIIDGGVNIGIRIGFDAWTVEDVEKRITTGYQAIKIGPPTPVLTALASLASFLFPNRVPYFLSFGTLES